MDESVPEIVEDPAAYAPEEALGSDPSDDGVSHAVYTDEQPAETHAEETPQTAVLPEESLPAGLRLTRKSERASDRDRNWPVWTMLAIALLCLLAGGAGGYLLHRQRPDATPMPGGGAPAANNPYPILPLNASVLKDVDVAFETTKQGQFGDARGRFNSLAEKHFNWPSMRIEAARSALYEHDFDGAEKILTGMLRAGPNADAEFLMGLLQMTLQTYDKSEAAFGRAVALDPSRPDIFYFWGECLRREGKPQDAAEKFHEALIRNQYETTEGLYQLKLWLSEIQADQESAKGSNAKIDADLASGHPSGPALFAAAARHIKVGQFKEASERIGQAQKVMEPAVFRVILQDPVFLDARDQPALVPFYKS